MRLFVAVLLPPKIRTELSTQISKCKKLSGLRWVSPEYLHLTLKFLGEVSEERLPEILKIFNPQTPFSSRFDLYLKGGEVFPTRGEPQVFWVGVKGQVNLLTQVAQQISLSMESIGFPAETRKFIPHLTLARNTKPQNRPLIRGETSMTLREQFCTLFSGFKSSMFEVKEIHLMQSRRSSQGSQYYSVGRVPLGPV